VRNDAELALPTVTIAEIAFGIGKIRPDQRAARVWSRVWPCGATVLPTGSSPSRKPALAYGDIMSAALRQGGSITAPDGMIAAIARLNSGRLATRNLPDFETTGLELICPWDF
jgi:predicted nucleic acid-binding protein